MYWQAGQTVYKESWADEIVNFLKLLQSNRASQQLRTAGCNLLLSAAADSSLQQTIPFSIIPTLTDITSLGMSWTTSFGAEQRRKLGSWLGQPLVLEVLEALKVCEDSTVVLTVLAFLQHLCNSVAYSLPLAVYNRVMGRVPAVWERMKGHASGSVHRKETVEERADRINRERLNGAYYFNPMLRERGWYKHIEKLAGETCEDNEHGKNDCTKTFGHKAGLTC